MALSLSIRLGLANTTGVSVLGSAAAGSVLSLSPITLTGASPMSYSVKWFRDGAEILGATSWSYTTTLADIGHDITATYYPPSGDAVQSSNSVAIYGIPTSPAWSEQPAISPASGPVGTVFTLTLGAVTGWPAPVAPHVLSLGGTDITGSIVDTAGVLTYTSTAAGTISWGGIATNSEGAVPSDVATAAVSATNSAVATVDDFTRDRTLFDSGLAGMLAKRREVDAVQTTAGPVIEPTRFWKPGDAGSIALPTGVSLSGGIMTINTNTCAVGAMDGLKVIDTPVKFTGQGAAKPSGAAYWTIIDFVVDDTRAAGLPAPEYGVLVVETAANIEMINCRFQIMPELRDSSNIDGYEGTRQALEVQSTTADINVLPTNIVIRDTVIIGGAADPVNLSMRNGVFSGNFVWMAGNAPPGTALYDPLQTYNAGDWCLNSDGYLFFALSDGVTGSGQGPAALKNDNAYWENKDVHADAITIEAADVLIISGCYIKMMATSGKTLVGENNGVRCVPNSGESPFHRGVEIRNNVVERRTGLTSHPFDTGRNAGTANEVPPERYSPPKIIGNWAVPNAGGEYLHAVAAGDDVVWQDNRDFFTNELVSQHGWDGSGNLVPGVANTVPDFGASVDNTASIPLTGTTDALAGAAIMAEMIDAVSSTVVFPARQVGVAPAGTGTRAWSGAYVGAERYPRWLKPRVWIAESTAAKATTSNRFGVGFIYVVSGQSNEEYWLRGTQTDLTGIFDAITDPEAAQIISLQNRGTPTQSDAAATIVGPVFVSDAAPISEGVSATVAMWNDLAPGLKIMIVVDAKGGVGQNDTLNDSSDLRMFENVGALFDAVRADGAEPGLFLVMHPNGIPANTTAEFASYLKEAFTGRSYATDAPIAVPGTAGTNPSPIDHIWPEVLPGILSGVTRLGAMRGGGMQYYTDWTGGSPLTPEPRRAGLKWLGDNVPEFVFLGGSGTSYFGDASTNFANDTIHFSGGLEEGTKNHGRYLATIVAQALGLTGTTLPQIDQIDWAADKITLGWSGGPITTRSAYRHATGAPYPTYMATGSGVLGFYDENRTPLRARIVNSGGSPATAGVVEIIPPDGETFSGASKVYYDGPYFPGGVTEAMQNNAPDFLLIGDQGFGNPYIGLQVQLPAEDVEFLNAQNALPLPVGVPPTSQVLGIANGGTQLLTPNMGGGQAQLTLELLGARTAAVDPNLDITRDSGGSTTYWRFFVNALSANPTIRFAFANGTGGTSTSFDGTVTLPAGYLDMSGGRVPRVRVVIDTVAGYVRLFVTPAGGIEVEITGSNPGPAVSATGTPFGVTEAGVLNPGGNFRTDRGLSFGRNGTYTVAHWKIWRSVEADGSVPVAAPWASVVADGSGGFTTSGVS